MRTLGIGGLVALSSLGLANRVRAAHIDLGYGPTCTYIESYDNTEIGHRRIGIDRKASSSPDNIYVERAEQFVACKRDGSHGYGNAGDYIDRGRYYWLDDERYYYIDAGQYNLLGGISHLLSQSGYPAWDDYGFRWWDRYLGGGVGLLASIRAKCDEFYGASGIFDEMVCFADRASTFADGVNMRRTDQSTITTFDSWHIYRSAGQYIDRGWYYCLDEQQYYCLEKTQYNLLGGMSYLLGHPCYPLWCGYDLHRWGRHPGRKTGSADKVSEEWADFYGLLSIFDEPAQLGDELYAFVAGDNCERILVGQFTVNVEGRYGYMRVVRDNPLTAYKDGALPNEMVTFEVWDNSAARWLHTEVLSGLPQWSSHGAQIRVDINAIPEPSSAGFIGLGGLGILAFSDTRTKRRAAKTL